MQIITDKSLINLKKLEEFIFNHPHGNIFQTPEMYEVYQNTKKYEPVFLAVINSKSEISGVLLAVIQKEYSGMLGTFTARSIIQGGPLIQNDDPEILDFILKEYNKIVKNKAIYSQFRNFWSWEGQKVVFSANGFKYEEHLNIIVDLTIGEDVLWKNVKKSRKEGIRKAKRCQLEFEVIDHQFAVPVFYNLLKNTYSHVKKPFPGINFFHKITESCLKNNFKFFNIKKNGLVIVSLFAFTFKKCIYAYYIGSKREHEYFVMRPIDLLYWKVMEWGINNNYELFDWLGAGKPDEEYGVREFKLQYGGKLLNNGRYEKVHRPKMFAMAKTGFKVWQKFK